ncbi:hypothetical protein [Pseudomonas sp. KNUC1026]|uniref:hypothetical protein n=1 Tax=Pseudomonas sp. KNUC1026 TaxID=2893890 RepID=UPI001F1E18FF|nr:hypothetical protein [Pseudomonas sp. KNUC1026]UFH49036.1 hypothetical protein LN139_19095 [Pseudomonas sp. KNUC1026]
MRWLFLLLLVLNIFYFGWSQLEAPVRPKEITSLMPKRNGAGDIRLLSEASTPASPQPRGQSCLFLGGYSTAAHLEVLAGRLKSARVEASVYQAQEGAAHLYWLRVAPASREVVDDASLSEVAGDIKDLKRKIMPCEGIATPE